MKILTTDIGTGTQDIFLFDSSRQVENCFKLILPSPTMRIFHQVKEATRRSVPILLTGVTMGGGPSSWAVESHLKVGLNVFATASAARTINDDLDLVRDMGVELVSDDESISLARKCQVIEFMDFDFQSIARFFSDFGVSLNDLSAIAVAVFDHGEAPPGVSDRQFRFDYLRSSLQTRNDLRIFAHLPEDIPAFMTRLKSIAISSKQIEAPLLVMDTAPAAVLGALFDDRLAERGQNLLVNIGNFHTIAFHLQDSSVLGVFEHHTGMLDPQKLEEKLISLANGSLQHETIFAEEGHGALILSDLTYTLNQGDFDLVVTGPRRELLTKKPVRSNHTVPWHSNLRPYLAVPFGDMMISGCFGLLAAVADRMPLLAGCILDSLYSKTTDLRAPWDI